LLLRVAFGKFQFEAIDQASRRQNEKSCVADKEALESRERKEEDARGDSPRSFAALRIRRWRESARD
jgi:hypothetical protein